MPNYTLGVEEEHKVVHPLSGVLAPLPAADASGKAYCTIEGVQIKPELHCCAAEVDTGICADVHEVEARLFRARRVLHGWCHGQGLQILSAGSHPVADWKQVAITGLPRYQGLLDELQDVARANLISGLHVHVAIDDPARLLQVMNGARVYLPHLLALSCSSPFWCGRDTGLMSMRSAVFARLPRTGVPPAFHSLAEYQEVIANLVQTGCIDDASRIWWDLRPHAVFPTLEFRICDIPTRVDDSVTLSALIQALVVTIDRQVQGGRAPRTSHRGYVAENKWRALRHGIQGKLVDFHNAREQTATEWVDDLLLFVDGVVDELGTRSYVARVREILDRGTSADRQRKVFRESRGDLQAVIAHLIEESGLGVDGETA
ncbi:MAG: carboxylate-amine ligase [Pseudomonadota bacterium]